MQNSNTKQLWRDISGQKFGRLLALKRTDERRQGHTIWLCVCDCGMMHRARLGDLTRGKGSVRSCGCANHPKGEKNKAWKGKRGIPSTYFSALKANAKSRGHSFRVSMNDLADALLSQGWRCALTGWHITIGNGASLDRIDSKMGYVKGNIQWVHKDVNKIKNNFTEERLREICKAIVTYAR